MLIANPIYGVFFKFLMEDTKIASKLLSAIIGEEIVELELRPQETLVSVPQYYLSVFRLDFKATIKTEVGQYKKVLIELQKGKKSFDIMRFRKYLGENYTKIDEYKNNNGEIVRQALPIIAIYFLGFRLNNLPAAVMKAAHHYYNVVTGEELHGKDDFVEQLIHDCFVIQIPRLQITMQNKIEKMLLIFNQRFVSYNDNRILTVPQDYLADAEICTTY